MKNGNNNKEFKDKMISLHSVTLSSASLILAFALSLSPSFSQFDESHNNEHVMTTTTNKTKAIQYDNQENVYV